MSKYERLQRHLEQVRGDAWHATFAEVERVLGFPLPSSARSYPAWWANSRDSMPQHHAWLDAGWRTSDLNLGAQHVLFRREVVNSISIPAAEQTPTRLFPTGTPDWHSWDNQARTLVCGLGMTWKPLGRVECDASGKLALPSAPAVPGVYCFRVRHGNQERRYIGESDNLARRFNGYRNPGSSQATNIRINALLLEALRNGWEVSVSAVVEDAWVQWAGTPTRAELSSKAARCLFENAAILESGAVDIETLNAPG